MVLMSDENDDEYRQGQESWSDYVLRRSRKHDAMGNQVGGSHYKDQKIQPIEYILKNNLNFCEGNIIKYITRHRHKGKANDIRKIIHYAQLILELEYGSYHSHGENNDGNV